MKDYEKGIVYIIGAGPGDPELLTLKAKKILNKCEIVLYDRLVNARILKWTKIDAKLIYVGKSKGNHTYDQNEINQLLLDYAMKGKVVARLKGGDPFVFGRGGEEAEFLFKHDVPFMIIPGVTSAIASAAYSGIPVSHRDYNSSFCIITGHKNADSRLEYIDWSAITKKDSPLVFLMGLSNLSIIVNKLLENGMDGNTPIAIIQSGTTPLQRVVEGTISNIEEKLKSRKIGFPSILVVGKVVKLRDKLKWYEKLPLFGKKIVITRPSHQADFIWDKLYGLGAYVYELPVVEIDFDTHKGNIENLIKKKLNKFDWMIFTSVNGVKAFFNRYIEQGFDIRNLKDIRFAAIGKITSKEIEKHGIKVDFYPGKYVAESFIKEFFEKFSVVDNKVLIIRSNKARNLIENSFIRKGAYVESVIGYRIILPEENRGRIKEIFKSNVDWVTFTSPSTVQNFFKLYDSKNRGNTCFKIATIGPISSKKVRELGYKVDVEAKEYTVNGLIEGILKYEKMSKKGVIN